MNRSPRRTGLALLTALALAACAAHPAASGADKPAAPPGPLDGVWRQVGQRTAAGQEYQKFPEGIEMLKFVTGGRFAWSVIRDDRVIAGAGGRYKVDGDRYSESVEYVVGDAQAFMVGKTYDFSWKFDGATWLHVGQLQANGQEVTVDEKWLRCK